MPDYIVNWKIDIEADSPEEAARKALEIQRRLDSIALVFDVTSADGETLEVDLLEEQMVEWSCLITTEYGRICRHHCFARDAAEARNLVSKTYPNGILHSVERVAD
jgi:hypothetical protein